MPEKRSCARDGPYEVNTEDLHEAVNGICLACGEIKYGGIEPDDLQPAHPRLHRRTVALPCRAAAPAW